MVSGFKVWGIEFMVQGCRVYRHVARLAAGASQDHFHVAALGGKQSGDHLPSAAIRFLQGLGLGFRVD